MSALPLVLANLIPLFGVLFQGWDLAAILLAFWAETAVIGLFTIVKIITARGTRRGAATPWPLRLFLIPFFCFHFGMFLLVHGAFVMFITSAEGIPGRGMLTAAPALAWESAEIRWFLLATLASHGFSTLRHHFLAGERDRHDSTFFMVQPYGRVVVLHLALLFGGIATFGVGTGTPVLVLLVGLKIGLDIRSHRRSHAHSAPAPAAA